MFRKKRASSNPPARHAAPAPGPAPSAASAAALAFLSKRASDANLSASAAAAALRSHTTSPEPIGAVQTKRMVRRGSLSSYGGSPSGSLRQPFSSGVQRSASSASMRDRSFRSPSPGGMRAPALPTVPDDDAPPIPAKSHRRTPSMESNPRPPPPRVSSPVATNTRGDSNGAPMATTVRYDPHTRTVVRVPVQNRIQSGNPGSPRQVNFSRPMSPPLTHNNSPREQVRARPATAQGFSSGDSLRSQPPMPNPSQMAAVLSSQSKAQTTGARPAVRQKAPVAPRPASSVGMTPGALVAASTAARPVSVASSPIAQLPATPQTRSVNVSASPTSGASPSSPSTQSQPKPPAATPAQAARPGLAKTPSKEQVKDFQARAAAMLARPLSDAAPISSGVTGPIEAQRSVTVATKPAETIVAQEPATAAATRLSVVPTEGTKVSSHSPSRSAHFSQSPLIENIKHQPPPRDLSPAKSALKAPSPRPSSPAGSPMRAASDTSDTRSDDGSVSGHKKKKSARVSFHEQPLVGEASTPMTPTSAIPMSPQYGKSPATPLDAENEQEYTPRPTLPSFGSVRGRKSPTLDSDPSTPTVVSQQESQVTDTAPVALQTSSDHAVGGVFAQDFATRGANVSSELSDRVDTTESTQEDVPSIAVLPATPRVDQENKTFVGPEDLDATRSAEVEELPVDENQAADTESDYGDNFADAAEDQSETEIDGGFASLDAIVERPGAETTTNVETSASNYAIGTANTSSQPVATDVAPTESDDWDRIRKYWSSLSEQRKQELEREAAKNVPNSEFASEFAPIGETENRDVSNNGVAAAATRSKAAGTTAGQIPLPPWPDQQYQESVKAAAAPPPMRQSMRTSHQRTGSEQSHLRTSMRDGNRPSSAYVAPKAQPATTQRPKSAVVPTSVNTAVVNPKPALKKPTKPALGRTLSNDSSASESSFRRQRRGSVTSSDQGGFSMRRSMRGPAQSATDRTTSPTPSQSNRFSFHSRSPSSQKPMNSSVRGSVDSTTPTLRANGFRSSDQRASKPTSPKIGFGRSSKKPKAGAKSGSRFKSRFNDSSDEDDDGPSGLGYFRSRFDDSDDDDGAPAEPRTQRKLAPVRGIPRKAGQASGDSTDLEDSDDEMVFVPDEAAMAAARRNIAAQSGAARPSTPPNANGTAEGKVLQAGTLRGDTSAAGSPSSPTLQGKSKRSFFGLGKKKQGAANTGVSSQPSSPLANKASPNATQSSSSSKLLRRFSSSAIGSDAKAPTQADGGYAVPPIPPIPDAYKQSRTADRPNTSDGTSSVGMPATLRPSMGNKRDSSMTAPVAGERPTIVSERTGRKKKFQGLRRLLGVHD